MSDTITETPTPRRGASAAPRPQRATAAGSAASARGSAATSTSTRSSTGSRSRRSHSPAGPASCSIVAAWLVIPNERSEESFAVETLRRNRDHPWLLLGVGLLSFGALLALSEARFWPTSGNVWFAATLGGAALVWWHLANRDRAPSTAPPATETETAAPVGDTASGGPPAPSAAPAPRPPARPSLFAPVLGALLAASGVFGLLAVLDVYDVDLEVALAAGVAIIGVAIAVGAMTQRRVGGLVFLGLVLLAAFGVAAATPVSISSGVGEKRSGPRLLRRSSRATSSAWELDLDLGAVALPAGTTPVDANVGIGSLVITVPEDVALEIDAQAGVGEIDVSARATTASTPIGP